MPCFEPVMMMEVSWDWARMVGRKVEMPLMTPKRLVSIIWLFVRRGDGRVGEKDLPCGNTGHFPTHS